MRFAGRQLNNTCCVHQSSPNIRAIVNVRATTQTDDQKKWGQGFGPAAGLLPGPGRTNTSRTGTQQEFSNLRRSGWRIRNRRRCSRLFGMWLFRMRLFLRRSLHNSLHGTNQNMRIPAFHPRSAIHRAIRRQIFREPQQQLPAQIRMRNLATTKLHHGFHTIAILQKPDRMILLKVVIVIVSVGSELQFLHLHDMLLLFASCCFFFISYWY